MILAFAEEFTIVTRGITGTDGDGNNVYSDTGTAPTRGAFAPTEGSELIQGEDVVLIQPRIYLEDGAPVPSATDQMIVRGVRYDIDGQPEVYRSPFTGIQPGPVIRLLKVT